MFDIDIDEYDDSTIAQRLRRSQDTTVVVGALKVLEKKDFTFMMGSGLMLAVIDLNGRAVTHEFMIRAEDMEKIKPGIIQSLRDTLELRKALLRTELASIESVLPTQLQTHGKDDTQTEDEQSAPNPGRGAMD